MKTCSRCGLSKPLTAYYSEPRVKDGRSATCRECVVAAAKQWNADNKDKHQLAVRKCNAKHYDRTKAASSKWKGKNREKVNAYAAKWAKANPAKINSRNSRHRAEESRATPAWANQFFIEEIYDLAQRRTRATGFEWQVDHVVPLRSSIVCGLHTEHNLRVIPALLNQRKGNRVWPDMP